MHSVWTEDQFVDLPCLQVATEPLRLYPSIPVQRFLLRDRQTQKLIAYDDLNGRDYMALFSHLLVTFVFVLPTSALVVKNGKFLFLKVKCMHLSIFYPPSLESFM